MRAARLRRTQTLRLSAQLLGVALQRRFLSRHQKFGISYSDILKLPANIPSEAQNEDGTFRTLLGYDPLGTLSL